MSSGSLWDSISNFIEPVVDWTAEQLGYVTQEFDLDEDVALHGEYSRGDQLIDDAFGFIKKGASAYIKSMPKDKQGNRQVGFGQTKFRPRKSLSSLTRGGYKGSFQTSPATGNPIGFGQVQDPLRNLLQRANNAQLNNLFAQFQVKPTIGSGRKTIGHGSTSVKGVSRKTATTT